MRFARPLSVLGATALLAAGAGLASPADAVVHTSEDGSLTINAPSRIDPTAASVDVSGTGCAPDASGKPSTVLYGLVSDTGAATFTARAQTMTANADGTWSGTVPVADIIAADGGSVTDSSWSIAAVCQVYGRPSTHVEAGVLLDNTSIADTTYTISGATRGSQTITVNGAGWTSGKEVTLALAVVDGDPVAELGKITPNADGTFTFSGTLPVVADGTYELTMVDTRGENGASVDTITVTNGVYDVTLRAGAGAGGESNAGGSTTDPGTSGRSTASSTPVATIPKPSASPSSSALARTGTNVAIAVMAGGALLAGGAALLTQRRKA